MAGNYCVYMHTNKINNKKYIGITCQKPEKRWENGFGYKESPRFWNAINKYGWDNFNHKILISNLPYKTACNYEIHYISLFNTNNSKYGYNLTVGGDASASLSDEAKEKIRLSKLGNHHSDETKEKMRNRKLGKLHPNAIKVICLNTLKTYDTLQQAADEYNIKGSDNISRCCRHLIKSAGKDKLTHEKLVWMFYEEYIKSF
jgi:group I intron endonuclease